MFINVSYNKYTGQLGPIGQSVPNLQGHNIAEIPNYYAGYFCQDVPYTDIICSGGMYDSETGMYNLTPSGVTTVSGIWDGENFHTPVLNSGIWGIYMNVYTGEPAMNDYTISGTDMITGSGYVWNLDENIHAAATEFAKVYYKQHVRGLIEGQVADDRDTIADISKNMNVLERFSLRTILHILGIRTMPSEELQRYTDYATNFLDAVDAEVFMDRADYDDEETMINTLFVRRNTIGTLVKTEYLDRLEAFRNSGPPYYIKKL